MSFRLDGARVPGPPSVASETIEIARAPPRIGAETAGAFERMLRRLGGEIDRGESVVGGAAHGAYGRADAGTLIALQAGIYRYSEALDLTVKLVDRAANATKTILEAGR